MAGHGLRTGHVGVLPHEDDLGAMDRLSQRPGGAAAGVGGDAFGRRAVLLSDEALGAVQHPGANHVPAVDGVLRCERGSHARLH